MSRTCYGQILKSSVMTGGAQVVTMLAAFVRMKIAAVTIGTAGVGMLGLLTQSTGLVAAVAGLGLNNSGVREVAAAAGSGDEMKRARVIRSLRVLTWITGLLGALICVVFAGPLSRTTFGDDSHRTGFMVLGAALFMTELATGQSALLRGLGRIRDLLAEQAHLAIHDPQVPEAKILAELDLAAPASVSADASLISHLSSQVSASSSSAAGPSHLSSLISPLEICPDPYAAAAGAHALLILTEWDAFKTLDYVKIFSVMQKPAFIFDGRNILNLEELRRIGFQATGIGRC